METRVVIDRLGHLGDGIASGPHFVPRTLPGEVVDLGGPKPRIITPSDARVRAPCPHYAGCGGCAVQHASDAFVAEWKRDVVRQALSAQGMEPPIIGIHTSPPRSRRRATFALKRTKTGAMVGFHALSSDVIVDTPGCLLVHPDLLALRPALTEIARVGGSRKGTISATVTRLSNGLDVAVQGGKPLSADAQAELASLDPRIVRLTWNGEALAQAERPLLQIERIAVSPPPGAFLQATEEGESALRHAVRDAIGGSSRVADLFAGIGTFALPLSREAEVHAVEGDASMTEALLAAWRGCAGAKRLTAEPRDLFRRPLEPDELDRFEAVVLDPPRAGAEAQVDRLVQAGVPRIAYVSCNPATFARDARRLAQAGYRVEWVRVVDQFRWSHHVELAACLTRSHTRGI